MKQTNESEPEHEFRFGCGDNFYFTNIYRNKEVWRKRFMPQFEANKFSGLPLSCNKVLLCITNENTRLNLIHNIAFYSTPDFVNYQ